VVVGRRFGKAVWRNKAKRIARTLFDHLNKTKHQACDMLFFPNKNFLTESKISLTRDFDSVIEKVDL
jgi:ribonuclease P protein component